MDTFCKYFTMEIPKRFQIVNKSISGEGKQDVQSGNKGAKSTQLECS